MKRISVLLIFIIIALFVCQAVFSQGADTLKRVKVLRVKENKAVSTAVILSKIKTKVGDTFSQDVLNDDLKRLYNIGFFTDISIDVSDYEDGIAVTFIVEEKPLIRDIHFKGNKSIRSELLKREMASKEGAMFDAGRLSQDITAIKRFYEKKGFHLVVIDHSTEKDEETNTTDIFIVVEERKSIKIRHIFLEGNENFLDKNLIGIMATRADALFTSGYFKEDVFEEDLEKLKIFYQREGYLDVALDSGFDYYNDNKNMDITIMIDEGKKYLVGGVSIHGNKIFTKYEIEDVLKLTKNKPFSQERMGLDAIYIQETYYKKGYIMCRVRPNAVVNKSTGRIDVSYSISEDNLVYVNKIDIAGNTKTKDVVIRRELRVFPGETFDGDKIKHSKERLYNLGYFEEISFDTKDTDAPDRRDLTVNVKETKTGEFSFGGGYSSIDKLIGFASVSQRNFDIANFPTFTGGGQNLTLRGEFGFVRTNYLLSWTDPWIFGFPYSFGFDLYRTTHERERDVGYAWEEERWGGNTRLGKEFTDWLRGSLVYRLDRVKISDIPDEVAEDISREEGSHYLSSLGTYLTFDTRDNVFNPSRGVLVTSGIEDAGGIFFGDFDFLKYTGRASYYLGFLDHFVTEFRVRGGVVDNYGDSDYVPVYERFYAGGSSSIRGYPERAVGPTDLQTGDPIGGGSLVLGNVELTFPVYKELIKGAVFYDIGNVWEDPWDIGQGDYKHGTGVGVRVKTPIGPVKLDWGYPLKKISGKEQKGRFYFSMSHGF